jgi:hypothetical protein
LVEKLGRRKAVQSDMTSVEWSELQLVVYLVVLKVASKVVKLDKLKVVELAVRMAVGKGPRKVVS